MSYPVQMGFPSLSSILGTVDWGQVFAGIPAAATAEGLAAAFIPIAGSKPHVTSYGEYSEISFTPDQEERVSEWILTQLNHEPGPVRVDAGGIALKVVTRKYWPYALGILVLGGVVGYAMKGR